MVIRYIVIYHGRPSFKRDDILLAYCPRTVVRDEQSVLYMDT